MFGRTSWILKGVRGAHAHAIYVVDADVIMGRSAEANIQILDQRVSRRHARLWISGDELVLEDLGSHNGTFVHGHKIARRPLRIGDRIQVGVSEYVVDQVKGQVLTSAIFLNKLDNKDTMGATAVTKRATQQILTAQTADMPRASHELNAHLDDPDSLPPRPSQPRQPPRPAVEPSYAREQRERAVRLPTPIPGELTWRPMTSNPPPRPARGAPRAPPPDSRAPRTPFIDEMLEAATLPLDPRTQRLPTPIPNSLLPLQSWEIEDAQALAQQHRAQELETAPTLSSEESPEEPPDEGLDAALRTVDAVVRLLKLRAQESGGALLKIQDREALRRLEGVLRESRRNRSNRRRWSRLPCRLAANVGERESDARVTDIGAGGLRVKGGTGIQSGDMVTIRVHLGMGHLARIAVFQTKVAWVDGANGTFGAIFAGPAHWELAS